MTTLPRRDSRAVAAAIVLATSFSLATATSLLSQPSASAIPVAAEFEKLHFRSIGPATMSGRISDLAIFEANPAIWYVGTAHGGVWKTTSNGGTFTPLFQDQGLMAIGDVAVSQKNADVVWVGTGESNNRQSTSWGSGLYKSTDGGKTFSFMGLPNSKHINRIIISPTNDDIVLVAATGPLFGSGGDRGVFRTTDGGKTWSRVLFVDDDTGANDLALSMSDPNVMFASTYQRRRTTCCMNGGGPGSGLWKSTDAGVTWKKITGTGFPTGSLGRISVDIFRGNSNVVFAGVEGPSVAGRQAGADENPDSTVSPVTAATAAASANASGAASTPPAARAALPPNSPTQPSNAGVTGLYRSDDGGDTWRKVTSTNARPMYFSQLRIDPVNSDRIYMGGVGLHFSINGGETFETDAALVTHDDVHAIWIDPKNPDHVIIGNDGGLATSYDMARTWEFIPNVPVGLFYHVAYDMSVPYKVCGGMQDNYDWCGPSASRMNRGIFNYDWFQILGGDGFVAIPDLRDARIVYTESQDGNMVRRNVVTGESRSIRPTNQNVTNADAGESYRFHWDTPLMLSPRDPGTLLAAANRVFRSTNRGDSWEAISPDLTKNMSRDSIVTMGLAGRDINISRNDGISAWPSIVSLGESPKRAGLYYAGTDDGNVSMSADNGKTWQNITSRLPGFPTGFVFISKVAPSRFDANVVYIAATHYRENDYNPYLWVSNDNGATFKSIASGLKGEVTRTITEDTRNPDVLYVGTETGIFLSLDRGATWRRFKANFPTVRVDELTIHPRDNALLVATHGRALWILDHLEPIQEFTGAAKDDATLFNPGMAIQWKSKDDRNDEFWGHQFFTGENPPTDVVLQMRLAKPATTPSIRISDAAGKVVRELTVADANNVAGIQTVCWDQRVEPIPAIQSAAGRGGRGGAPGGAGVAGPGGAAGAGPGGAGPGGVSARPIPGLPVPLPPVGYLADNPCTGPATGGGGGSGFGGGGATNSGPYVMPGTYMVSMLADGKVLGTPKPLNLVMDPEVQLTGEARARYNALLMELHESQRRGTEIASQLNMLYAEVRRVSAQVDSGNASVSVKAQFAGLKTALDSVRVKFGVPVLAAGGFGGGGRGGGAGGAAAAAAAQANVLGRLGAIKASIQNVWETPSAALLKQANDARAALTPAMTEASSVLSRARTVSTALNGSGIKMAIPASPPSSR